MKQNVVDTAASAQFISDFIEAANTNAVAALAADVNQFWAVDWIGWSYNGTPTGGRLTVQLGSTVILDTDITTGGPGIFKFGREPLYHSNSGTFVRGEALTITLYSGGSGVTGKVYARVR